MERTGFVCVSLCVLVACPICLVCLFGPQSLVCSRTHTGNVVGATRLETVEADIVEKETKLCDSVVDHADQLTVNHASMQNRILAVKPDEKGDDEEGVRVNIERPKVH
jgi:hypothetical protein